MGYQCYEIDEFRDGGYGVPAWCDHPGCTEQINRGVGYMCGDNPHGGDEFGCGLFFCGDHSYSRRPRGHHAYVRNCKRCFTYRYPPYKPRPEHPEWINWKLKDKSWEEWRQKNPKIVELLKTQLAQQQKGK